MHRLLAVSPNWAHHDLLRTSFDRNYELHSLNDETIDVEAITNAVVELGIDAVVLDIDLGETDGLSALTALQANPATRHVPIVMITCEQMDSQTALALNKGAADCVSLPCSKLVIQARIRHVCQTTAAPAYAAPEQQGGRLIAFIGAKGGVGTTTVAVNAGVALVERQHSVTIVDLRGFFGTMAAHLGVYPSEHPHNLAELLDGAADAINEESVEKLLIRHTSGMKVLLGAQEGDGYHRITGDHTQALVASLRGHAEYTIFDLPTWPTDAVETVLANCEQVILVLEREPAAVQAAQVVLSTLVSDGIVHGDIAAVVVNRGAVASPIPVDYLQQHLDCPIIAMIPPASDACAAAARSHEPLIQFRHDLDCAEALEDLAEKLTQGHLAALAF